MTFYSHLQSYKPRHDPVLLFPHCWVAIRELQSSCMAKMWDILQLFAELQVETENGPTLPTLLGSY